MGDSHHLGPKSLKKKTTTRSLFTQQKPRKKLDLPVDRKVTSQAIITPLVQLNVEIAGFTSKTPLGEYTPIPRAASQDLRQQNWDQDSSHGFTCTHSQDTQGTVNLTAQREEVNQLFRLKS